MPSIDFYIIEEIEDADFSGDSLIPGSDKVNGFIGLAPITQENYVWKMHEAGLISSPEFSLLFTSDSGQTPSLTLGEANGNYVRDDSKYE